MNRELSKILRTATLAWLVLVSVNILLDFILGGYEFSIGKFHVSSHKSGKLLLIQLLLALILRVFFASKKGLAKKSLEIDIPPSRKLGKRFVLAAMIAIVVLSGFAYYQALPGFFLSDDFEYLNLFDHAKSLNPYVLFGYLKGFGLFRPLSILSLYADFGIWHLNPFGYHLTNLALHILNASLLLFILFILSNNRAFSLAGALLFSLFPAHPEAVSWISGRFDVLCATFYLAAILFFLLSSARSRKLNPFLVLSLVSFILALLSKEMALSLPLVLILIEMIFRFEPRSHPLKDRFIRHGPFWLIGLIYLTTRLVLFQGVGGYAPSQGGAFFKRFSILDLRNIIIRPFSSLFLPLNDSLYPQAALIKTFLLILISVAIFFLPFRKNMNLRLLFFGFRLIPLPALPAFKIFYVSPTLEGARFLYLPSIGASIIVAAYWGSRDDHALRAKIWMSFPVVLFLLFLVRHNTAWNQAFRASRDITHQALVILENVDAQETIHVVGLPDNYKGAYIFRNGFASAINLFRNNNPLHFNIIKGTTPKESYPRPGDLILEWKMNRFELYRLFSSPLPERNNIGN